MVSSREALVADAVAVWHAARKLWGAHAVDGRLVALKICEAGEVCGRGATVDVAGPCSVGGKVSFGGASKERKGGRGVYFVRLVLLFWWLVDV